MAWIIPCKCGTWIPVLISIFVGGHCSRCGQHYNRWGQPIDVSDDQVALDDFLSELSDDDLIGFIQSDGDTGFGPEVN